jgi:hypothetical protein
VPEGLRRDEATALAKLVDSYRLAGEAGLGKSAALLARKEAEARRTGRWSGSALELWACHFSHAGAHDHADRPTWIGRLGQHRPCPQTAVAAAAGLTPQ